MNEIETREFFVFVMTPHSIESDWCRRELAHAEKHGRQIALARVFSGDGTDDAELASKYSYGDFSGDFEQGFRHVMSLVYGEPVSSWESLIYLNDDASLLKVLNAGFVPALIAKELAEWVVVAKAWNIVEQYAAARNMTLFRGDPRTPIGVFRQCDTLIRQFAEMSDALGVSLAQELKDSVFPKLKEVVTTSDDDHAVACRFAAETVDAVRVYLRNTAIGSIDAVALAHIQYKFFDFDVAEKLRELVSAHARRSRYLY